MTIMSDELPPGADWKAVADAIKLLKSCGYAVLKATQHQAHHAQRLEWVLKAIEDAKAGDAGSAKELLKYAISDLRLASPLTSRQVRDYLSNCLEEIVVAETEPAHALNLKRKESPGAKNWKVQRAAEDINRVYQAMTNSGATARCAKAAIISIYFSKQEKGAAEKAFGRAIKAASLATKRRLRLAEIAVQARNGVPVEVQMEDDRRILAMADFMGERRKKAEKEERERLGQYAQLMKK